MAEAVFLSAGVPDPKRGPEFAKTANAVAITSAVIGLVYVLLGRRKLVWGGHPAITPMIWEAAESVGIEYGKWVQLYQSTYFKDDYPEDNKKFGNVVYTDSIDDDREKSLLFMRSKMFSDNAFSAAVFIGGMGGILQEFELFRQNQPQAKVIPIISTGGAVLSIATQLSGLSDDLTNDLDYVALFHRHLEISVKEQRYRIPADQPEQIEDRYWQQTDAAR